MTYWWVNDSSVQNDIDTLSYGCFNKSSVWDNTYLKYAVAFLRRRTYIDSLSKLLPPIWISFTSRYFQLTVSMLWLWISVGNHTSLSTDTMICFIYSSPYCLHIVFDILIHVCETIGIPNEMSYMINFIRSLILNGYLGKRFSRIKKIITFCTLCVWMQKGRCTQW